MYNEIKFLFDIDNTKIKGQKQVNGQNYNINIFPDFSPSDDKKGNEPTDVLVRYKGEETTTNNKIKDFLNDTSYYKNDDDSNPFVRLIEKLNESNNKSIQFGYKDLAYLADLGVYPVNRMIVLRRFSEGVEVPHNLNDPSMKDIHPISTVIGWIDPESDEMFKFGFSENWITNNKFFWDQIAEIVSNDTGVDLKMTAPSPSWAQGFLFNFLKEAKYVDEDAFDDSEIPVGDPDVLKESSEREVDNQGLKSSFSFSLSTSYEQKYINNIDPGSAFLDIINNSLRMGTSDMKFFLGGKTKEMLNTLNSDSDEYINSMYNRIKIMASDFIDAIGNQLGTLIDDVTSGGNDDDDTDETSDFIKNGLNAALYRFRWPLRGSLAVTTGQHTTPWHITLGHPLNPVISMANVLVESDVSFNNEFGFNDLPTKMKLDINISQSRSLGKQEIMEVLNNAYGRVYTKK